MTEKAVRGILRRKMEEWLKHIDDKDLREEVAKNIIVTGGAIVSLLRDEKVGDYDVYLKNKDVLIKLMQYYLKRFAENPPPRFKSGKGCKIFLDAESRDYPRIIVKSAGLAGDPIEDAYQYFETQPDEAAEDYVDSVSVALRSEIVDALAGTLPNSDNPDYVELATEVANSELAPKETGGGSKERNRYRPVFLTTNAITLSDRVQVITRFFGTPEEIHKNFDYVHCTGWYDHGEKSLNLPQAAVISMLTKELRYTGSLYPMCSIIRRRKFAARGWSCNAGQELIMMEQVNRLDLDDIDVWEDQLIGVDTAYFQEIIGILRKHKAEGKDINASYVVNIIEKLF